MLVRLRDADRELLSTVDTPLKRIAFRTFRHAGMLYERIADGEDGTPEYRATERRPPPHLPTADLIDASGNVVRAVPLPLGHVPRSVTVDGVVCPLWTLKDQAGRAVYLRPPPRVIRGPKGRVKSVTTHGV